MTRKIQVQPLTEEAFSRFGKILRIQPDQEPLADNADLIYWEKIVEFEPGIPRTIGLLTEKRRKLELLKMERHTKALEWFVPIDGECVACFADYVNPDDPDERPDVQNVVAFRMSNIVGFVVNRGAWHWPAFPITETATQLVNLRRDTEHDDVDVKELAEPIEIVV
jgi:ureidoglycolate lyase